MKITEPTKRPERALIYSIHKIEHWLNGVLVQYERTKNIVTDEGLNAL